MSFKLAKDVYGYVRAIASDKGWFYLHLETGTVRNEANAQKLVDVLNAAEAAVTALSVPEIANGLNSLHAALAAFKKEVP